MMNDNSMENSSDRKRESLRRKYRLEFDWHTHTSYSRSGPYLHAKGTILEVASAASALGLKEVAITDHGPGEIYGINQRDIPKMRDEIAEAKVLFPELNILLGVEANFKNTPNGLDVKAEDFELYDFVNAGYHYGVLGSAMISNTVNRYHMLGKAGINELRKFNTELAVRALYSNNIRVLTHPGDKGPFDMRTLCKACEDTNTLMEINSKHKHMTVDEIRLAAKYDVQFIIGSDAHQPSQVGRYVHSLERAIEAGLDIGRIVNIVELEDK